MLAALVALAVPTACARASSVSDPSSSTELHAVDVAQVDPTPATDDVADTDATAVFVSPADAWRAIEAGAVFLDAGDMAPLPRQRPSRAIPVDWQTFSDDEQRGRLSGDDVQLAAQIGALGVGDDAEVYVIGSWSSGWGEEGRIYWMLLYLGHDAVHIVDGGHDAWHAAGLPTGEPPTVAPAVFTPARRPQLVATLDQVRAGAAELLDVREPEEYAGATPWGSSRGGHVPGAVSLPWRALFDDAGGLRDATTLGVPVEAPVITYCTGGVRSAFVFAVLRSQGVEGVANYAGSWWEYADSDAAAEGAP